MDYTNFVKNYYRNVISKLNHFSHYSGIFANLNYSLDIPKEKQHFFDSNFDAFPNWQVNINAEPKYFEEFLDYVTKNTPSLAPLTLGTDLLRKLYQTEFLNEQDDEKTMEKIDLITDISLEILKNNGVIK